MKPNPIKKKGTLIPNFLGLHDVRVLVPGRASVLCGDGLRTAPSSPGPRHTYYGTFCTPLSHSSFEFGPRLAGPPHLTRAEVSRRGKSMMCRSRHWTKITPQDLLGLLAHRDDGNTYAGATCVFFCCRAWHRTALAMSPSLPKHHACLLSFGFFPFLNARPVSKDSFPKARRPISQLLGAVEPVHRDMEPVV